MLALEGRLACVPARAVGADVGHRVGLWGPSSTSCLLNAIGAGISIGSLKIAPGANLIAAQQWETTFWTIALLPAIGIAELARAQRGPGHAGRPVALAAPATARAWRRQMPVLHASR